MAEAARRAGSAASISPPRACRARTRPAHRPAGRPVGPSGVHHALFRRLDEPRPELDIDLNPGAIRVKGS